MSAAKAAPPASSADRHAALALTPVSRETGERLDRFVELLLAWQKTTNLISPSTLPQIWTRHIADSLQLIDLAPDARSWIDLGSGGGFPGVVIACALAGQNGAAVHLVESNAKKAAFLREAGRATGAPVTVHAMRIEKFVDTHKGPVDAVTARALAPLKSLLTLSFPLLAAGSIGLFPKGQDVDAELTEASKYWNINHTLVSSRTDRKGRIVIVRALDRRRAARQSPR
jgi:16S rRNA (guanine527-N7)-methyltransferase